jgi:hypothetical protein
MLYSKTASILGSRGWIPLKAGDTIISELVVLNDLRNRISQIDGDITVRPVTTLGWVQAYDEYLNTEFDLESAGKDFEVLLATDRSEVFPEFMDWTDEEIYILGMVLTDAYYTKTGGIEIYQSAKKKRVVDKIDGALGKLNYVGTLSQRDRDGKHYTWRIHKKSADEFKDKFCLADRGNPSLDLIHMTLERRRLLLNAMMDGDGTWNRDQDYGCFYKPQIIDFFQILAMSLGYRCKINGHRKQIYISNVGFEDHFNTTKPVIERFSGRHELLSLETETKRIIPILKDNGKVFFGGLL